MAEVREIDAEEIARVRSQEVAALPELGTEAIRVLEVEDFPVWVVNDCEGRDCYQATVKPWRRNDLLPEDPHLVVNSGNEGDGGGM
jgi:hypothetical protein